MKRTCLALLLAVSPAFAVTPPSDPIKEFPSRVKKITLKNGMRVLIMERSASATISFAMFIRTGGMDDDSGKTGLAHMFEHMLFKGTRTIGTKDYAKEAPILDEIDDVEMRLQKEAAKLERADAARIKKLRAQLEALEKKHAAVLVSEEYWQIYERAGGQDMNASTGYDFTNYIVSLPKNFLKLWVTMEADRIRHPVLREFYKERSVVLEERRQRVDNSPQGRLWESFLATAFQAHPYGRPIVGWESDISRVTRKDAEEFFKTHYDVSRLVVSIVGGVKTTEVEALLKEHFESIPTTRPDDTARISVEPKQQGERRVAVEFDAEPSLLIGYHRPDMLHPDNAALSAAEDILSAGRTSRFYRQIVQKKRVAVSAWGGASTPGERDANLFVLGGTPRSPHTAASLEKALYEELEKLKKDGPTEQELQKVKNRMEASVIRSLSSNDGLASQLAYYEAVGGDWMYLIRLIDSIRAVTADDVKRVATTYLEPSNRTVATLVRKK